MADWVARAGRAYEKKKKQDMQQKTEDAKTLAVCVSRLLGEVVSPAPVNFREESTLAVQDGVVYCVFAFADTGKQKLALQRRCHDCDEIFLIPVSTLADLGEILSKQREGERIPHPDCQKPQLIASPYQ